MYKSLLIIGILVMTGCATEQLSEDRSVTTVDRENIEQVSKDKSADAVDKEKNICATDSDCEYIWYTGSCNVPEYVAKIQKEQLEKGMLIGEAPPRENVTCTCENNKCITHG